MPESTGGSSGVWSFLNDPNTQQAILSYINSTKNPDGIKMVSTPEEKWLTQKKQQLFDYSPTRHYVSGLADQALQQMSGWKPNMTFKSSIMQGEDPLGGYKMPTFDFSKLPRPWEKNGTGGTGSGSHAGMPGTPEFEPPTNDPGTWIAGPGGMSNGNRNGPLQKKEQGDTLSDLFGKDIYEYYNEHPGGNFNEYIPLMSEDRNPSNDSRLQYDTGQPGGVRDGINNAAGKLAAWGRDNPNAIKGIISLGAGALFQAVGIPGLIGTKAGAMLWDWFQRKYGKNEPSGPADIPAGGGFNDFGNGTVGDSVGGGSFNEFGHMGPAAPPTDGYGQFGNTLTNTYGRP